MKKLFTILIGLSVLAGSARAQFHTEVQLDYNTFSMNDLKRLQEVLFVDPVVPMKTVSSFPGYLGFRGSFTYTVQPEWELEAGAVLAFTSTGGRVQYKDFSGEITGDQFTNVFTAGIIGCIPFYKTEKIKVGFSLYTGLEATNLKLRTHVRVNDESSTAYDKFKAVGIGAVPALYVRYYLNEKLYLIADAGYHLTVYQNTYRWSQDDDAELSIDEDGRDTLKPNWDGLRAGVGVGYTFGF